MQISWQSLNILFNARAPNDMNIQIIYQDSLYIKTRNEPRKMNNHDIN